MLSTKPCQDFTGSAAATSRCCLTLESPENSEAETEISYMVPQPPLVSFIETSFDPGRAFRSMVSSSASEGGCGGGEASEEEE